MKSAPALTVMATGLVTSVGLTADAACAAMRTKLTNPCETRFIDAVGKWIMAHEVTLDRPWRGREKLARMAAMAIEEALKYVPRSDWQAIPLLLCVAEAERPGRTEGLDDRLFSEIEQQLQARFATDSVVVPDGRIAVARALAIARAQITERGLSRILIVAADSLLTWRTLAHFESRDRLLTERNSNGFLPGEGAAALLVGPPSPSARLAIAGLGFAREPAPIDSELPLRADGMSQAFNLALADAGSAMLEVDFRISDLSGEQYYFKEAALALTRTLRARKEEVDLWHPAECIGETGAVAGGAVIALADAACRKGYARGRHILAHFANDDGWRAAVSLQDQRPV